MRFLAGIDPKPNATESTRALSQKPKLFIVLLGGAWPGAPLRPTRPSLGISLPDDLLQTQACPAIRVPVCKPHI
jgi:hypothetical protein